MSDITGHKTMSRDYTPESGAHDIGLGWARWTEKGTCSSRMCCGWKCTDNLRSRFLRFAGVKLSKSGRSVFNYDPGRVTMFINAFGLFMVLPPNFDRWWYVQLVFMIGAAFFYANFLSDFHTDEAMTGGMHLGQLDTVVSDNADGLKNFANFVLGLYISLAIAQTYYKNRGVFGTVFGSSLGLSQMVVAWIRPSSGSTSINKIKAAQASQEALVRWNNAAYRLLVLEVRDIPAADINTDLVVNRKLLSEREWKAIENVPSRATHIYQWMNNVLFDLFRADFINEHCLVHMQRQVDLMRGANVWGLPSLPLPYTLFVTALVKTYLLSLSLVSGIEIRNVMPATTCDLKWTCRLLEWVPLASVLTKLFISNFVYQGALDLHGWIYSPNGGEYLGHLPSENFLDFVQKVCYDMLHESGALSGQVPYKLYLP